MYKIVPASEEMTLFVRLDGSQYVDTRTTDESREAGKSLRTKRSRLNISLSNGAGLLGISVTELSDVEIGKRVFADAADYARAVDCWRAPC